MKTIAILLAVVVVMGGLAFVVVSKFLAPGQVAEPSAAAPEPENDEETATPGVIFMVEELLVNPTGTSGTRYLSASIGLEVADHEVSARLEGMKLQIRDLLITILSARTVDQLTTPAERETMRAEIIERLNRLVSPDQVRAVYYVDYVLQ